MTREIFVRFISDRDELGERRWIHPERCGLIILLLRFWATPCSVKGEMDEPNRHTTDVAGTTPSVLSTAPVQIDGEILFQVRGISAFPADQRAQKISERIKAFAADRNLSPQIIRLVDEKNITTIVAGNQPLGGVTDADGRLEGVERQLLAHVYAQKITEAVESYRAQREPKMLILHTLYALLATGFLSLTLFGLRWSFSRFDAFAERRYKARIQDVTIQTVRLFHRHQLWLVLRGTLHGFQAFCIIALLYGYLEFVLGLFPWTAGLGKQLLGLILNPLHAIGLGFLATIPNLIFLGILTVLTRFVLKFGRLIFANIADGKVTFTGFDREWAWPTYKIFRAFMIFFALIMAYPHIPGSESAAFKGITIFLGVLFSLSSTSVIGNIIAGYTLVYRRAFRVGDRIKINEQLGDVVERRLFVTHLRTPKNEEVIVPNSEILNSLVINYSSLSKENGLILSVTVGIGYETPWRQVEAMLLKAAGNIPGISKHPPPFVFEGSLGDFCVTYELNAYCEQPQEMLDLSSRLRQNILDVFNEYGVQIMTPAYISDPPQPKVVPKKNWYLPPTKNSATQGGEGG